MEVLKVKVDFENLSSGSIPESPKTCITRSCIQEQKNKLQILKNNPLFEQQCDVREMYYMSIYVLEDDIIPAIEYIVIIIM